MTLNIKNLQGDIVAITNSPSRVNRLYIRIKMRNIWELVPVFDDDLTI